MQNLANFSQTKQDANEIFLVVKAPKGTTLEVPDIEDEEEKYPH